MVGGGLNYSGVLEWDGWSLFAVFSSVKVCLEKFE